MLIKNGTIIDGTKKKRFQGDVRIEGDKIRDIGKLSPRNGERTIYAKNKFVVPGFVDILNRSDIHLSIFENPSLPSIIKQGITTIIGGGCGSSLSPLARNEAIQSIEKWEDISRLNINWATTGEFLDEIKKRNLSANFATLTGHATLRRGIVGNSFEKLKEDEMKKLEYLLERSLEEGSFGLSTGLAYSHAKIAPPEELNRLAAILKKKGGIYATHLRNEGKDLIVSVNETITLTKENELSSHIFHFKASGKDSWSEFEKAIDMLVGVGEDNHSISIDIYPYTRTASVLYLFLPDWASHGGRRKVLNRIRDEQIRKKIIKELEGDQDIIGNIVISSGGIGSIFVAKTISHIAKNQEVSIIDALLNIILASNDRVIGFTETIDEKNIIMGMTSRLGFIASDGAGYAIRDKQKGDLVHPRAFGAFPRFLGNYVRDKSIMSWEEAIAKITSGPAEKIGLKKRGEIKKGHFADIVIFDPKRIIDKATFENPFQHSEGIDYVFVNGGLALRNGKFQKKRYGRVLRM